MQANEILTELQQTFPDCWFKPGDQFDPSCGAVVWSGEGSEIDNINAFNFYSYSEDPKEKIWILGVHRSLHEFVTNNGYFWESHDPGTYLLYEI